MKNELSIRTLNKSLQSTSFFATGAIDRGASSVCQKQALDAVSATKNLNWRRRD